MAYMHQSNFFESKALAWILGVLLAILLLVRFLPFSLSYFLGAAVGLIVAVVIIRWIVRIFLKGEKGLLDTNIALGIYLLLFVSSWILL